MKGMKQGCRGQQGSVLVVVMGILFVSVGLVVAILDVASNARKASQEQAAMEQAMFVAEGGMEIGTRFVESNIVTLVSSVTGATNGTGTFSTGGSNTGTYTYYVTRTNGSSFSVISTGSVNAVVHAGTIKRVVSLMRVYQPSYAQYSFWAATNGGISFAATDVFDGAVHTDDQMTFITSGGNGATFNSTCTSLATTYAGDDSGCTFADGLGLGVFEGTMATVDFNSAASTSLKNEAGGVGNSGTVLSGSTTITFNGGTVSISNDRQGWTNKSWSITGDGIIYVKTVVTGPAATQAGTIYLNGGHVTGRLTIASEDDITIGGNITYTTDPVAHPTSTDALGLLSWNDVWVGTSAPDDVTIDAAIMATGGSAAANSPGSFGVINYNSGGTRGNLTVYGGIVQEVRGAVGTANGQGVINHGFSKNYSYDPRFINTPPPYYPTVSGVLKFTNWTEGH
jgi:hypothetical protein